MLDSGRALTSMPRTLQYITDMDEEVESLLLIGAIEQGKAFFSYFFPYVHSQGGGPVYSLRRLVHYHRPAGRIPSCSYARDHHRFFRFRWRENIHQFFTLPFGLISPPQALYDTPLVESQAYRSDILPRQYFGSGEVDGVSLSTQRLCPDTAVGCRFVAQFSFACQVMQTAGSMSQGSSWMDAG